MNSSWKVQIFEQKTLWEVYFLSRRVMPRNKFNRNCVRFATVISVAFFVTMMAGGQDLYSLSDAGRFLRALANASFLFSLGILGFLIAGFAIFASVTNAKLFIMLASIPYGDGRINRLQFVFFNFLNVFTIYIALMSVALFTMILLLPESPFVVLGTNVVHLPLGLAKMGTVLAISIFLVWLVVALVRLKSFIWSLYQTVLVSIAAEAQRLEQEAATNRHPPGGSD